MHRKFIKNLEIWKISSKRKPLILNGARQVGKTWILKEFGRLFFKKTAYVRFDNDETAKSIFNVDYDVKRIVKQLSLLTSVDIDPMDTLIIFDEIQECPKALTSLKYFCEDAPEYHVVAAGSLLGVKLAASQKNDSAGTGFPVGKVDYLDLEPMNFCEFLEAVGLERFVPLLVQKDWDNIRIFGETFRQALKNYLVVGGMPEVVATFVETQNYYKVRKVQQRILRDYNNDFAKHAPKEDVPKIRAVWNSVPQQLSKENKRFVYSEALPSGAARNLESALWWLFDSGLLHKVTRVSKPSLPLKAYEDGAFKLFFLDVGLLGAMSQLDPKVILDGNKVFSEFKGALTEQYVHQELRGIVKSQFYWNGRNSEIDFLVQSESGAVPIEVKAEMNLQAKSLKFFCEKYGVEKAIRFSMGDCNEGSYPFGTKIYDYPLFGIMDLWNEC